MSTPAPSLRPHGATIVVLVLDVRDARSWAGADTTVRLVPQPADGQPVDDAGRPVITHAATGIRAVVHGWTATTSGSGLVGIPVLASRDDAFEGGGFGGYLLTDLTGTRLIEVPDTADEVPHASAELVTAVAATCTANSVDFDQLGITEDGPVRVLPVDEAPPLPAPGWVVPDGYDTSRTSARRIDRRLVLHDQDPDAHQVALAGIRAALALVTGDETIGELPAIAGTGQLADGLGQITDAQAPASLARVTAVSDMIAAALAALIGSPGVDLDTWIELANWVRTDRSGLTNLAAQVAAKLATADLTSTLAPLLKGVGGTWARNAITGELTFTVTGGSSGSGGVDQTAVAQMWSDEPLVYATSGKLHLRAPQVYRDTLAPALNAAAWGHVIVAPAGSDAATMNIAAPTGTPVPGRPQPVQVVNPRSANLTVKFWSALSNVSLQNLDTIVMKPGTVGQGGIAPCTEVSPARWLLTGFTWENP